MKTRTNFQKAAIRSAAVVVSFVLVSYTVSAQEFWKKLLTNSSINEIAVALVEMEKGESASTNSTATGANWNNFDKAFDPALELEDWMADQKHFEGAEHGMEGVSLAEINTLNLDVAPDAAQPLELEDWMLSENGWTN